MLPITEVWDWPAPAKINLFLHVTGRRVDGYHLLQTVFQLVDLADVIRIRVSDDGSIHRLSGLAGLDAEQDLAIRAARLLQHATGCSKGAELEVVKCIPAGAGLGGGSSDAATVLVALNEMWGTGLDVDALSALGLSLGADVPVFVRGHTAWAEGVGDVLTPIAPTCSWYVIVFPGVAVSTAEIFSDSALTRSTPHTTIPRFLSAGNAFLVDPDFRNDLQTIVEARFPRVSEALGWLRKFGPARMSGSGASVFAAFGDETDARAAALQCPQGCKVFVIRGLLRSPLLDAVMAWRSRVTQSGQT